MSQMPCQLQGYPRDPRYPLLFIEGQSSSALSMKEAASSGVITRLVTPGLSSSSFICLSQNLQAMLHPGLTGRCIRPALKTQPPKHGWFFFRYSDLVVIIKRIHHAVFQQYLFQSFLRHRRWYDKIPVFDDSLCQVSVLLRLIGVGSILDYSLLIYLCPLHHIVPGHEIKQLCTQLSGKCP